MSPASTIAAFWGGQVTLEVKEDGSRNVPRVVSLTARIRLTQHKSRIDQTHVRVRVMQQQIGRGQRIHAHSVSQDISRVGFRLIALIGCNP